MDASIQIQGKYQALAFGLFLLSCTLSGIVTGFTFLSLILLPVLMILSIVFAKSIVNIPGTTFFPYVTAWLLGAVLTSIYIESSNQEELTPITTIVICLSAIWFAYVIYKTYRTEGVVKQKYKELALKGYIVVGAIALF